MLETIYLIFIITTSLVLSQFIMGLLFSLFKANKYEDQLADKVAKKVNNDKN